MKALFTLRDALSEPRLLGGGAGLGGDSWAAWRAILLASVGEPLTEAEAATFQRTDPACATRPSRAAAVGCGRQKGRKEPRPCRASGLFFSLLHLAARQRAAARVGRRA